MINNLIPIKEWAELNNLSPVSVRQKCARGSFDTAVKIGRDWLIDKDEPNPDRRVKNGKYKNWRK